MAHETERAIEELERREKELLEKLNETQNLEQEEMTKAGTKQPQMVQPAKKEPKIEPWTKVPKAQGSPVPSRYAMQLPVPAKSPPKPEKSPEKPLNQSKSHDKSGRSPATHMTTRSVHKAPEA